MFLYSTAVFRIFLDDYLTLTSLEALIKVVYYLVANVL